MAEEALADISGDPSPAPADDPAPPEQADKTEEAAPSIDDDLRAIYDKHNSGERGPDGRFAKRDDDQSPTEGEGKPAPEESAIPVPQSWSAEVKAKWASLPSDVQALVAKREQEAHTQITKQGQQIKEYEPFGQLLEQAKQTFGKYGMAPDEGFSQLLNANAYLERDARSAIRDLAKAYNVDLRTLANLQPGNGASPDAQALLNHISQLETRLNETSNRVSHREQEEQARAFYAVQAQIADFAKDKPEFAELEADIEREIIVLKQASPDLPSNKILEEAFDRARWANPASRAKAIEADRKAAEAKRLKEAKERSTDAKRVAPLNIKNSPANSSAPRTWDDDLKGVWNRLNSSS